MWLIRAGRGGDWIEDFLGKEVAAVGFLHEPVSKDLSKAEVVERLRKARGEAAAAKLENAAGQLLRFLREVKVGDPIATYDPDSRNYYLGTIAGEPRFDLKGLEGLPHVRDVRWTHKVPRDALSGPARNTLGAIQTLFRVNAETAEELRSKQVPKDAEDVEPVAPVEAAPAELRAEMAEKAESFIEDRIQRLDWEQMQDLVAGILRAMGYRTTVAAPGPDRGVDIRASPDGLGLQEPRIFVEVKHRAAQTDAKVVRAFLGGRKHGDRCLFVSTGGFTKDAHYEADRSQVPLTLLNLANLRALLVEHYDRLDAETRALVPLKRLYWPVD